MSEFITLAQALDHIDSGKPFDCEVVTCDVSRGTGGVLRTYRHCVKFLQQPLNQKEAAKAKTQTTSQPANHFQNSTKNIFLTHERKVKTIHNRLIVRFNGKQVS